MKKNIIIGVYKITSPKGRIYIGQSIHIEERWGDYRGLKCKGQPELYDSFIEHGVENHTFEIITTLEVDDEHELDWLEIYFIKHFDCFDTPHGMNLTEGGSHGRASAETRKKQSDAQKGKTHSEEQKRKNSESKKGKKSGFLNKKHTKESRKKQSDSHKGKKLTEEHVKNSVEAKRIKKEEQIANGTYVKKTRSAETKAKISKSKKGKSSWNKGTKGVMKAWNKGIQMPEEQRLNMCGENSSSFGKKQSKERINKRVETKKRNKEEKIANGTYIKPVVSQETKDKISVANTGKKKSVEYKNRMSDGRRKGENSPLFGKARSEESKEKQRVSMTGKTQSAEHRRKNSEANKGENNAMFGIKMSAESVQKGKDTKKRNKEEKIANGTYVKMTHSEETRQNMRKPKSVEHTRNAKEAKRIIRQERLTMIF